MAFSLRGILSLDNKGFLKGIDESVKGTEKLGKGSQKASLSVGGIFKAGASLAGAYGIAKFAKDSVMLASNLIEVQNVVDTTFGSASKQIDTFSKGAATKFGLSELQAKQFSSTLGAMAKSSGISGQQLTDMSTGLAGLTGDMASFYNLDPAETFEKLKSGIAGEVKKLTTVLATILLNSLKSGKLLAL